MYLLVAPLAEGGTLLVVGGNEEADQRVVDAWVAAARCATARLGSPGEKFRWSAIIGHSPSRVGGSEFELEGEYTLGGMQLCSAGQPLTEPGIQWQPTLFGGSIVRSWPMVVTGTHRGHNWPAASTAAALDLHRLCALLSVYGGEPVVVREAPIPGDWGTRAVPERPTFFHFGDMDAGAPAACPRVSLGDWVAPAWDRMARSIRLEQAVGMFHEGLRAHIPHPSLALVAYIASIEAVTNTIFKEVRCPTCDGHRYIGKRFRATVALVTTPDDAKLLGNAYTPRSNTVHRGVLHGSERYRGAFPDMDVWARDPVLDFEWRVLQGMRTAARALLIRALQDDLPARGSIDEPWIEDGHAHVDDCH